MLALGTTVAGSHIGVFAVAAAFGFLIGIFGHLAKSRTLILTGIAIVAAVSVYYVFVLEPAG